MRERGGLSYSSVAKSEFRLSRWDRLRRAGLFLVAFVLLAVFFSYLTGQVQESTAHATGQDVQWDEASR